MPSTDLQQHHDRLAYITRDHWRKFESYAEHAERVTAAEETVGRYFTIATGAQKEAYRQAVAAVGGLYTPRADRTRDAAMAIWHDTTREARELFALTLNEIMRDGEASETTLALWDALPALADLCEVA